MTKSPLVDLPPLTVLTRNQLSRKKLNTCELLRVITPNDQTLPKREEWLTVELLKQYKGEEDL